MTPNSKVPQNWREAAIQVLYKKKGDRHLPENYRPICIIPILYKLFSKLLLSRIDPTLQQSQNRGQAGSRADFRGDDQLMAITLVAELAMEKRQPLWVAAVDFKKAFDTVAHSAL